MNPTETTTSPLTPEEKEQKAWSMINEMEIKLESFKHEARIRLERVRQGIEETNHHLNVAKHEIGQDMANGIKKMSDAEKAIVFPEDVE